MRVTNENDRLFLWLSPLEYLQLEDAIPSIEYINWDVMHQKGFLNCILDYPRGKVIAVLDDKE